MNCRRPSVSHIPGEFLLEALEPRKLLSHTSGLDHELFMPEGFSARDAAEVVEVTFADESGSTDWELWAHYERDGEGDEIVQIAEGTIDAGQTQRVAIWGLVNQTYRPTGPGFIRLVRPNEPYALVLRSASDDVTALLRHSDFGAQTAQYFTDRSETEYTLAGIRRNDDASREFIVLYNSSERDATIWLELDDGAGNIYRYRTIVPSERRGGWDIRDMPGLPEGVYTARVSGDEAFVLGGTRYALGRGAATIELPAQTLAEVGVILDAEFDTDDEDGDDTLLFVANPGETDVRIEFRAFAGDGGTLEGPARFVVNLAAGESTRVSLRGQGYTDADDDFSLTYRADASITVNTVIERRSELSFGQPETRASNEWFFDGGLIGEVQGIGSEVFETEDVLLFNPSGSSVDVTVTFTFSDGTRIVENQRLSSLAVASIDGTLDYDASMGAPFEGLFFSVSIESTGPIVAMLELERRVADTSQGAPIGTVADLAEIAVF